MRKTIAFNPHWIDKSPAWDIRIFNGNIHRGVTDKDIRKISNRVPMDLVRECDIQDYGNYHLIKERG